MASEKQIAANRQNAKKSAGPKNTESTRFNATRHGLLSAGLTELDDAEGYERILADLMREKKPVGVIETHRVKCMALDVVKQLRAQRLEAEFITAQLNPPTFERDSKNDLLALGIREVDPGIPATLRLDAVQYLVTVYQRYESFFSNDLSRNERELERSQRMRHGERLPAPATIELTVRADTQTIDSTTAGPVGGATLQDTLPSPLPEANRADEAAPAASPFSFLGSVDYEQSSATVALWQRARPKPIWSP
jgi:hypothetical protein